MAPTNKGNYSFCVGCLYQNDKDKYPCDLSHKKVRGEIDKERNFKICLERRENVN